MIDYATCRHLNRDLPAECLDFAGEASEVTLRRGLAVIEGDLLPDGKRLLRVGTHRYQVDAAAYGKATSGATEDLVPCFICEQNGFDYCDANDGMTNGCNGMREVTTATRERQIDDYHDALDRQR